MGVLLWPAAVAPFEEWVESTAFNWLSFSTTALGSKKMSQITMAQAMKRMIRVFNIFKKGTGTLGLGVVGFGLQPVNVARFPQSLSPNA